LLNNLSTIGGILSVALSVNVFRHCPGITWQRALWSPDFPRTFKNARDHPTDSIQMKDNRSFEFEHHHFETKNMNLDSREMIASVR